MGCVHVCAQIGKKTEGEFIDLTPERKEAFATATFDLEAIRWQRARCAILLNKICAFDIVYSPIKRVLAGSRAAGSS